MDNIYLAELKKNILGICKSKPAVMFFIAMVIFLVSSIMIAADFLLVFAWSIFGLACLFSIGGVIYFFGGDEMFN